MIDDEDAPVYARQGAKIEKHRHVHLLPSDECIKKRRGPKCQPILAAMYRELDRVLVAADEADAQARAIENEARAKRDVAVALINHTNSLRKAILVMEGASEEDIAQAPRLNRRRLADVKANNTEVSDG